MRILILLLFSLAFGACGQQSGTATTGAAAKKSAKKAHLVEVTRAAAAVVSSSSNWHGSLDYNKRVNIFNQEKGRITYFPFREGDTVKAGAVLMRMDDRLLRAERGKLVAQIRQARTDRTRIQRLVKQQHISADELDRASTQLAVYEAEQKLLDIRIGYFEIKAPFSGVITERLVNEGDAVTENSHLLTLSDEDSLTARVQVSESMLSSISTAMAATVVIPSTGDKHPGSIARIYPKLHPTTRQATVEITFNDVPKHLFSGQSVLAEIAGVRKKRILVPLAALKRDAEGEHVFLLKDDGKAYRQAVNSAAYYEGQVEITQGIDAGDTVITKGFLGLSNGKQVKIAGQAEKQTAKADKP